MDTNNSISQGSYHQRYTIGKKSLGSGGNGTVWEAVRNEDGIGVALKILNEEAKSNKEKCLRFEDEINTMLKAAPEIAGVMPIWDYSLTEYWYAMPVAESISKHINGVESIVDGIIQIAGTLVELHNIGLAHRDIKPGNLLFYNDRFYLCDFGLVDIPDNPHGLTKKSSRIGPVKTIAPEMSRNPRDADGRKADVYSLAKTLWILLTDETDSFEGHYDILDATMNLHKHKGLEDTHLVEIHELLADATQPTPDLRPTMAEFRQRLELWKDVFHNSLKAQISNWQFLSNFLFTGPIPTSCCWRKPEEIVNVLNILSNLPLYSYLFFSDGGSLDYERAELSTEQDCIDIVTHQHIIYRIKPSALKFESFNHCVWNYFLLELDKQEIAVGTEISGQEERVVEDYPGHYVSAEYSQYWVYDYDSGVPLPKEARVIHRYLGGKFLIVLKFGPYNSITQTSDGRHGNCSSDEFRKYIESLEMMDALYDSLDKDTWKKRLHTLINDCPFKPQSTPKMGDSQKGSKLNQADPDFVNKNMASFDFMDVIAGINEKDNDKTKVSYLFRFHESRTTNFMNLIKRENFYLSKKGMLLSCDSANADIFTVSTISEAFTIFCGLTEKLDLLCGSHCDTFTEPYFSIIIHRSGVPEHLFTQDEIETLMLNADDRTNNTLVIDAEGYAHILQAQDMTKFYPVVYETWCAGNNYVGRYSKLSDLESAYHYCLGQWYDYLKTNEGQSQQDYDLYGGTSTEEFIKRINELLG